MNGDDSPFAQSGSHDWICVLMFTVTITYFHKNKEHHASMVRAPCIDQKRVKKKRAALFSAIER